MARWSCRWRMIFAFWTNQKIKRIPAAMCGRRKDEKMNKEIFENYEAIIFFDTETTGFDAKKCQIIELAAIRVEYDNGLVPAARMDTFISLPAGEKLPGKIVELTGITDALLEAEGKAEDAVLANFLNLAESKNGKKVLIVAHNAQFDLNFLFASCKRCHIPLASARKHMDFLDTLTVFKDRRAYPHKLADAIKAYHLEDQVQNTHRAIDDVEALAAVFWAMQEERADLLRYVNVFGYNGRYGISGERISGIRYHSQAYANYMRPEKAILPNLLQ